MTERTLPPINEAVARQLNDVKHLLGAQPVWRSSELYEVGIGHRQLERLTRTGVLIRLRHGGYVQGTAWSALNENQRAFQRIAAHFHVVAARSNVRFVYSHTSAARLHGLPLWNAGAGIHVTVPFNWTSFGHATDVQSHTAKLQDYEVVVIHGLPATGLERTVVDCARVLRPQSGLIVADHALRQGADPALLQEITRNLAGHKGIPRARLVIDMADSRSESAGESRTREVMSRMNVPMPQLQYEVMTRLGRYRLDFAWPEWKLALEFDGRTKYVDYQPTQDVLIAERQREKALMEDGWTILRIEWNDLNNEVQFRQRLFAAIARAKANCGL